MESPEGSINRWMITKVLLHILQVPPGVSFLRFEEQWDRVVQNGSSRKERRKKQVARQNLSHFKKVSS
jgi:hypothetical protein